MLRPLPLDNGALNEPGKLNSRLSPSEWGLGLCSQLLRDCCIAGEDIPQDWVPGSFPRGVSSCSGAPGIVSQRTMEELEYSQQFIFPSPICWSSLGYSRPSKLFSHEVPCRVRLVICVSMDLLSHVSRLQRPKAYSLHLKSGHLLPSCKLQSPPFSPSSHPPPQPRALATLWCFSAKLSVSNPSPGHGQHQTVGGCSVGINRH